VRKNPFLYAIPVVSFFIKNGIYINTFAKSRTKIVFINLKYRKWVKLIILLSPIHVPPISSVAIHISLLQGGSSNPEGGET
jgi:hypothetical protein